MTSEKGVWVCPECGAQNDDKFCENCGAPRSVASSSSQSSDDIEDKTQVMPPVSLLANSAPAKQLATKVDESSGKEPPLPSGSPASMTKVAGKSQKRTIKILSGVAIFLLLAVIGIFAYISGAEERYEKKVMDAEQVTMDVRELVLDIKSLQGNPDSDSDKEFIDRIEKAQENLDKLSGELNSIHTGSKYKSVNGDLVEAVKLEQTIFTDVQTVLNDPLNGDGNKTVSRVRENVKELKDRGANLKIEQADFTEAMDLTGLDQQLAGYIQKRRVADAAAKARAKAEAAAKAKAAAEARAKILQQKKEKRMHDELEDATAVYYIALDLQVANDNMLKLNGFFMNLTENPVISADSFDLDVRLYKNDEVVYTCTGQFSQINMIGLLYPHTRQPFSLNIVTDGDIPDFDDFRVSTSNMNWTYYR